MKQFNALKSEDMQVRLMAIWDDVMAEAQAHGDGEAEAMMDGLRDQAAGDMDMSAEDLDDEMAELMGWTLPATDAQLDTWRETVDAAARIWLAAHGA